MRDAHEVLRPAAMEYAKQNVIAMPGDIVSGNWGDWKKDRNLLITNVSVEVIGKYIVDRGWRAVFQMVYVAKRIKADGSIWDGDKSGGIVPAYIDADDGKTWMREQGTFNHSALRFSYAKQ